MANDDDFEFVLEPRHLYWFVVEVKAWSVYRKVLKHVWGKQGFSTVLTEEHTPKNGGPKVVFVVLKIGQKPITVSATIMGAPGDFKKGDNSQSVGAFEVPQPHWMAYASDFVDGAQEWAEGVEEQAEEWGDAIAERAGHIADAPERWMAAIENRSLRIAALLVAGGLGALAIYKVTTS